MLLPSVGISPLATILIGKECSAKKVDKTDRISQHLETLANILGFLREYCSYSEYYIVVANMNNRHALK